MSGASLDILLLDLPPGTADLQQQLFSVVSLDGALVVVGPQDVAHLDATQIPRLPTRAGVLVLGGIENMSGLESARTAASSSRSSRPSTDDRSIWSEGAALLGRDSARFCACGDRAVSDAQADAFAGVAARVGRARASGSSVKKRLDVLLVERGLAETRTQAQALVLAGRVRRLREAGYQVDESVELEVTRRRRSCPAAARSSRTRSTLFGVDPPAAIASTSARRRAVSPTVLLQRGAAA